MKIRNRNDRQLGAWLIAGMSAPVAGLAGRMPWQSVALIATLCLVACWLVGRFGSAPGKWMCILEYIWMIYVLSWLARGPAESWASETAYPAVPLILLTLAAASAYRGADTSARVGSSIFWLIALIYSAVIAAGLGEAEIYGLAKDFARWNLAFLVILLIPTLAVYIQEDGKKVQVVSLSVGGFAVLISVLVTGTLSPAVAVVSEDPLREWVSGLSLVGTLERFEAIVSVALTMGWFALLNFMLCVAGRMLEGRKEGGYSKGVMFAAVSVGVLLFLSVSYSAELMVIGCVSAWFLAPMVRGFKNRKKN